MVRQLAREYETTFLNNIRNPHIQATIAENFADDSETMAGPTNSIKEKFNSGANAKPRAESGTTIPTGSTSRTSARSGTATIQRLEKQQKRVKNPQNPYERVAWLEQAASSKHGRSESDDEDDVEEGHREKRRHIDDTSFSPEKVAHRRSVQSTEKENNATGGSTPGNSPKKSVKKVGTGAPAPRPSSGKRKAILVDDSESDDGEATVPSAKKTAKDGEYVPSDTEEDVPTPKPKPTKTKKKTVRPADAEEEEPVAPVAKKKPAKKTVPPGDAEKETVKAPAVRPRKKTKRTVDSEDDEDAIHAGAPDHQGKESSKASTRVPRKNKNAMLEDPAMTDDSFFVTLRSAMKLEGPMPPGSLQFIELYMTAYGLYITAQKLLQEERRLVLDAEERRRVLDAEERRLVLDADINKLNQEYQRQYLALREKEIALREKELNLRERENVLRANEIQGGGN